MVAHLSLVRLFQADLPMHVFLDGPCVGQLAGVRESRRCENLAGCGEKKKMTCLKQPGRFCFGHWSTLPCDVWKS